MSSQKPVCWGDERQYDPEDMDCDSCRFQHSCRAEVTNNASARTGQYQREDRSFVPASRVAQSGYRTTPTRSYVGRSADRQRGRGVDEDTGSTWDPGLIHEGENPLNRLGKDMAVGSLRGAFYEGYQFFRNWRWE